MAQPRVPRRPQRTGVVFAALTVIIGLGLAGVVVAFLSSLQQTTTVVQAARDLPAFTQLTAGDVRTVSVPAAGVSPGVVRRVEDAIGRFALGPLVAGQTLMEGNLADVQAEQSLLAGRLTRLGSPATRAFAVPVENQDFFGGEAGLRAGDRVDVIAVVKLQTAAQEQIEFADTILQNVPVLSVLGGSEMTGAGGGGAVVLAVTHEQAQMLAFAQAHGTLRLALVPYASENQPTAPITIQSFLQRLGIMGAPAPETPADQEPLPDQ